MANKVVAFRLADVIIRRMDVLAGRYGVSRAAVVSLAISRLWEQEYLFQGAGDAWEAEGDLVLLQGKQERKKKRK